MSIKNRVNYIIFFCISFLFINISFSNIKDINSPGYQRLYYPIKIDQYNNLLIDRVVENIPKKRNAKVETNYYNKYLVTIQLSSTIVEHSNGTRIYSVN